MRRALIPVAAIIALFVAAPVALAEGETVAAIGTGQIAITPTNRHSEAAILAAVNKAQARTIPAALEDARATALKIADAAGLTLGTVLSVEQQPPSPFIFTPFSTGRVVGPFNGKFCHTVKRPIFKRVNGKRKVVRRVRERQCFVPPFATASLQVTFRAAPRA